MELRDNPDHVTAADVGNVTILGRGCRCGIRPKGQRGKAEEARCQHEHRERPSMIAAGLEKPLNPSTLMSHRPHLIISHVTVSWRQAEPVLFLPALSLLLCLPHLFPYSSLFPIRLLPAVLPASQPALQAVQSSFRLYSASQGV